ncbi:hypothetical protein [Longimicrobium sp.]|uniref:hypothetical protein n=1 Tax=Longimicrobium sp. TaxID=2029185 RepID=UPI002E3487D3|nr:hypothetical protein [Longimicrobium sp.]HEX6041267.1 hypothetical protein [Longimicrobium sp.]
MRTGERTAGQIEADLDPAPGALPAVEEAAPLEPMTVVREGWRGDRVPEFAMVLAAIAIVAGVVASALGWMETPAESGRAVAWIAVLCVVAGVRLRGILRWRHEYVLNADGIALWRNDTKPGESEWSRIAWGEMTDRGATLEGSLAGLAVVSRDRRWIVLEEDPAPPQTVAFIRRFMAEAERHPRAEMLPPPAVDSDPRGSPLVSVPALLQLAGLTAFTFGSLFVARTWGIAPEPTLGGLMLLFLSAGGLRLWADLESSDIAYADRDARGWWRRMRNRLRRLFGIRHV